LKNLSLLPQFWKPLLFCCLHFGLFDVDSQPDFLGFLGIWWPRIITNQELWERTGQSEIDVEIKRRKYGWIGHTLQKSQNEICYSVLEWDPQERRSRGRPKATWRRTVLAECGKISFGELRAQARNRHRWKLKTDGLCSTGVWL
jgi:hypothetical protein